MTKEQRFTIEALLQTPMSLREIHRSYFYFSSVKDDSEVEDAFRIAGKYGDGFEKIYQRLRIDV